MRDMLGGMAAGSSRSFPAYSSFFGWIRDVFNWLGDMLGGLGLGLAMAILVIFLLLSANFQSLRLSLVTVSTAPAVIAGVVVMLYLTSTTLNIQSFIGAIMAVGVAMANAILLVTFAESRRRQGEAVLEAAIEGAGSRLRPILMTTCAMMAGMLPMALALGESGQQNAPLGRAVIGGLAAATVRNPVCASFGLCFGAVACNNRVGIP